SVVGPPSTGPGESMTAHVSYVASGPDAPGVVTYRLYLSSDAVLSANDSLLFEGTRAVAAGQTIDEDVSFTVPARVLGGDSYLILVLDPLNAIVESKSNDTVASIATVHTRGADLAATAVQLIDPAIAAPVQRGLFGQPARLKISASNAGDADAANFKLG